MGDSKTLEPLDIDKARAIAARLASDFDNEALSAARLLVRLAKAAGHSVQDLIAVPHGSAQRGTGGPRRPEPEMHPFNPNEYSSATHAFSDIFRQFADEVFRQEAAAREGARRGYTPDPEAVKRNEARASDAAAQRRLDQLVAGAFLTGPGHWLEIHTRVQKKTIGTKILSMDEHDLVNRELHHVRAREGRPSNTALADLYRLAIKLNIL